VRRRTDELLAVQARALGAVVNRQVVQARQCGQRVVVYGGRLPQQVFREERAALEQAPQVGRDLLGEERLERLASRVLLEVDAVGVALVAAFAVLPGHHWVVQELVEPRADQRVCRT